MLKNRRDSMSTNKKILLFSFLFVINVFCMIVGYDYRNAPLFFLNLAVGVFNGLFVLKMMTEN